MDSGFVSTFLSSSQFSTTSTQDGSQKPPSQIYEDYLDCDDILTLGQKVTCVFEKPVTGLGFIDPSSDSQDIVAGCKLELPVWLAKVLKDRKVVSVEIPKGFNETYREILEADASVVDLHNLGPNYYRMGKHLVEMDLKDSQEISKTLVTTFHDRFHKLLDYSIYDSQDTASEMIGYHSSLDNMERDLLAVGRASTEQFRQWSNRSCEKITANQMVSALNKKKRVERSVASIITMNDDS